MSKDSRIQDELSSSMTGGRLRRYAKVTSAMGGLAARLAGEKYLGIKINREQHASDLRAALGGLKGPLMKVAQILAGKNGLLMAETPLTLAETASVFGEMLVFRKLLNESSIAQKKQLLSGKIEDMLNLSLIHI